MSAAQPPGVLESLAQDLIDFRGEARDLTCYVDDLLSAAAELRNRHTPPTTTSPPRGDETVNATADVPTIDVIADDGETYTIPAPPAELAEEGARILDSMLYLYSELELLAGRLRRFEGARSDTERAHEDGRSIYEQDAINEGWSDLTGNAGIYRVLLALGYQALDTIGSDPPHGYERPTAQELRESTRAQLLENHGGA